MRTLAVAVAGIAALWTAPAWAGVTVLGSQDAHACSEAAKSGRSDAEALELCTFAIEGQPLGRRDLAGTYVNRAVVYLIRRDWDAARRDLAVAGRLQPSMGEVLVNQGAALMGLRQWREALDHLDRGLAIGSEEPEKAYFNRAVTHEELGEVKDAYLDYRRAADLKPAWGEPQLALARFHVERR